MILYQTKRNFNTQHNIYYLRSVFMTEEFLHYVWKYKLFEWLNLTTTAGETVEIIKSGEHNFDSGPDFFNSKIKIGPTLWAGNVEIHINASDWEKHNHANNKAYSNVILHVVFYADKTIKHISGEDIPTIELKERIPEKLYQNYIQLKSSKNNIPCESHLKQAPSLILQNTFDKCLIERLEEKSKGIREALQLNTNNWEETFYCHLAKSFGFKTNATPFELLAKSIPLNVLGKHKNSLLQIEAILFGQAGLLETHFSDSYPRALQNEYILLKNKFNLQPLDKSLWKFLRLYPANFPTIRIAQFANLIHRSSHLFSKILETKTVTEMQNLLSASVSDYWQTHYLFEKISSKKAKNIGNDAINSLIINTIVPFLFVYGKFYNKPEFCSRAFEFLENLGTESNHITKKWESAGINIKSAYISQAVIQLNNNYCNQKKCLHCMIGNYLLKNL